MNYLNISFFDNNLIIILLLLFQNNFDDILYIYKLSILVKICNE